MPYSTGCTTPLSNFEANLEYKDTQDPAVTVSFALKSDPEVGLLAWTTTPWTLPSNLMLCVNDEMTYIKIEDATTKKKYILAEDRLVQIYKNPTKAKYTVLEKMKGTSLLRPNKHNPKLLLLLHQKKLVLCFVCIPILVITKAIAFMFVLPMSVTAHRSID